ncbi:MAG: hypothetical protein AB1861_26565 [Cyanobacteriota bacterium]
MDVQEIVDKWYALGSGKRIQLDEVPFFRFVAIWIAFNALYASRGSNREGDRNQVRRFAGNPKAIDYHQKLLKEDSDYQEAIEILKERGVYDTNLRRQHHPINDITNLTEVAECFYQVRCNLFHGGKIPNDSRDKNLVQASYTIVSKLIKPYISNFDSLGEVEDLAAMASDPQIQTEIAAINQEFFVAEMDGLK